MVMDAHGMSHKAKGKPDGGQYESKPGVGGDDDLDPMLKELTAEMRGAALIDRTVMKSPEETASLLAETDHVEIGVEGAILYDAQGNLLFRETGLTPPLDYKTMRSDPKVRLAARRVMRDSMTELSAADRRRRMKAAWRLAGPYDRRRAIDASPNARYIPATGIAASLSRRRDQDAAVRRLIELHEQDANVSANIIRNGYPKDRHGAWMFINNTMFEKYEKDVTGPDGVLHRKGEFKVGDYEDKDGHVKHGRIPAQRGSAARSYLRMLYQPTNGVPDAKDTKALVRFMERVGEDGPEVQARAFWELCYGNGSPTNLRGDVDFAKHIISLRNRHGASLFDKYSRRGQGNAARMVAYNRALSREAAIAFVAMEPGDGRSAHTGFTRRRRNRQTGVMETVKPKRLTEMRAFIRSTYEIGDRDVEEYKARRQVELEAASDPLLA